MSYNSGKIWEKSYSSLRGKRLWPDEITIDELDLNKWRLKQINRVLDAGCGDGKNLAYLVENGFFVIGVDASKTAFSSCRSYLASKGVNNNYFFLAPCLLESIPLVDSSIEAAICIDVLGHIPKPSRILKELYRILAPGGYLSTSIFHPDDECRLGPRMRKAKQRSEYWYKPSSS